MPMQPLEHDYRYGELHEVVRAHLGQDPNLDANEPGPAVIAYLRHTWHNEPRMLAVAERQLREYSRNPPGSLRKKLGEFYSVPDVGIPEEAVQQWLAQLAEHIKYSVENGIIPPPAPPVTRWEWHALFPEFGQMLSGWFSQDMPDEFSDHAAAVDDYRSTTHPRVMAQVVGEIRELLALELSTLDYTLGMAELGSEVEPPHALTPEAWLMLLADQLAAPQAEYGQPRP